MSENTLNHIDIVQSISKKLSNSCISDVVVTLLKYLFSDARIISLDDFTLIDQYLLEHPGFRHSFYNDVVM